MELSSVLFFKCIFFIFNSLTVNLKHNYYIISPFLIKCEFLEYYYVLRKFVNGVHILFYYYSILLNNMLFMLALNIGVPLKPN